MKAESQLPAVSDRPAPDRPKAGRPRKLSHDAVLDAALALLAEMPPQDFTLAKLAQRLGAATMSLYTYYPSRDALLEAVAERAFSLFVAPPPKTRWQDTILDWLRSLQAHVDLHPVAMKVMAWDGRMPMAWLRVWTPILTLLSELGLSGEGLALTFDWFINAAVGLILTQQHATRMSKTMSVGDIGMLSAEEGLLLVRLIYDLQTIPREARFEMGFRRIVEGLEGAIAEAGTGKAKRK